MDKILNALLALVVAVLSVACAWLYFQSRWQIPLVILVMGVVIGIACYFGGPLMLPNRPVWAVYLMEWWILAPLMVAVLAGAFIIYLGVELEPSKDASVETQKLLAAAFAAFSGFLTTAVIEGVAEADTDWVGGPIRKAFYTVYDRNSGTHPLPADSEAERWVFSDPYGGVTGWGFTARHKRAKELEDRL